MFRVKDSDAPPGLTTTAWLVLLVQLSALLVAFGLLGSILWEYVAFASRMANPAQPLPSEQGGVVRRQLAMVVVLAAIQVAGTVAFTRLRRRYRASQRSLLRVKMLAHDILASLDQGVVTTDQQGVITSINSGAIKLLGVDFECVGRPIACIATEEVPLDELERRVAERREPIRDREFSQQRDGRARRLLVNALDLKDNRGRTLGCVLILRDVTERLRMKEQMWRLEQFASLSTLATGLHHEIKNPLTALSIHVQLLDERLRAPAADGAAREIIEVLKAEVRRLNGVLESFRDFANLQRLAPRPTDAATLLENIANLIRPQADRQGVRLAVQRPDGELPAALLDPEKFEQAVLNLVINALEAMPAGGDLTLAATAGREELEVTVEDTGPGIPEDVREFLFKPYFSTKDRGTGMGLALAEKLVRQHGGRIDFRTGPAGTCFRVVVPLGSRSEVLVGP
jgi:two-component system, NtrC family, sensor histidine kinase HydH